MFLDAVSCLESCLCLPAMTELIPSYLSGNHSQVMLLYCADGFVAGGFMIILWNVFVYV